MPHPADSGFVTTSEEFPRSAQHPYRQGYSVLPRLRKITLAEVFQPIPGADALYQREKQRAMATQEFCVEQNLTTELCRAVTKFLKQHHPALNTASGHLRDLMPEIQEDLVIHALEEDRDWMAFGHVCFPSGWLPEEKIGQPLRVIHEPIPGMDLSNSHKLVETMVHHGPFERFVWSVVFEPGLNFHPKRKCAAFNPKSPQLLIKVERQVTVGFPDAGGALFLLHQSLIPFEEIDLNALLLALQSMTAPQRAYKGLAECAESLENWLQQQLS